MKFRCAMLHGLAKLSTSVANSTARLAFPKFQARGKRILLYFRMYLKHASLVFCISKLKFLWLAWCSVIVDLYNGDFHDAIPKVN